MLRWTVADRDGREIYPTAERWEHIEIRHEELIGHREDVLNALRFGRRRQERRDPQRFRYRHFCHGLSDGSNSITVIVVFGFTQLDDGTEVANNFVTTAWGETAPEI